MKIAITGKGGVGKTTLSALLSHIYANEGKRVIAVDADPDAQRLHRESRTDYASPRDLSDDRTDDCSERSQMRSCHRWLDHPIRLLHLKTAPMDLPLEYEEANKNMAFEDLPEQEIYTRHTRISSEPYFNRKIKV